MLIPEGLAHLAFDHLADPAFELLATRTRTRRIRSRPWAHAAPATLVHLGGVVGELVAVNLAIAISIQHVIHPTLYFHN